jgi:hypothetical protein
MKFLRFIKAILLILFMILTLVFFIREEVREMCFFGIVSTWYLIDMAHYDIRDKLK